MHTPPTAATAPHARTPSIHMGKPKRYIKARPSIPPLQPVVESSDAFSVQGFPACLVLNADYSPLCRAPLSLWGWQDVVRAVIRGTATTVSEHEGHVIRSPNYRMKLPSVVVLNKYVTPRGIAHTPTFSRYNVFLRDDFTCQYCNCQFKADLLTYDHVVPRTLNGPTTWDNVVTSCSPCNNQKAGKALSQLKNMQIRKMPHAPTRSELQRKVRHRPPPPRLSCDLREPRRALSRGTRCPPPLAGQEVPAQESAPRLARLHVTRQKGEHLDSVGRSRRRVANWRAVAFPSAVYSTRCVNERLTLREIHTSATLLPRL